MSYRSPRKDHIICHLVHIGAYAIRPYLTNRIGLSQIKNGFLSFGTSFPWIKNEFLLFCIDLFRIKKRFIPFCINLFWIKNGFLLFRKNLSWIKNRVPPFCIGYYRIEKRPISFCRRLFWIKERGKRFCGCITLVLKRDVQNGEGILWAQSTKKYSSYLVALLKQLRGIPTA